MKRTFSIFLTFAVLLLPCISGGGQIYKWVDGNGVIHFSDSTSGAGRDAAVEQIESPASSPQFERDPSGEEIKWPEFLNEESKKKDAADAKVELYTTAWCGYCRAAKAFLTKKGIPYVEYDIEKDRAARERKQKLSPGSGVPVAVINGRVINGFSPGSYESVLNKGN